MTYSHAIKLPNSWTITRVGEVCTDIRYGYTASASEAPCGPRFLRITDIQNGQVRWKSVPYCAIEREQIPKYALSVGDIVFARTGGTVGKSFLIASVPEEAVFASYLIRLSTQAGLLPKFLYYFFQSGAYWEQIGIKKGGLQGNVNATTLSSLEFPICPFNEQVRIVAKIEGLFSQLDNGIESLKTAREQLKVYRQSVLKHAFEGKLTAQWRATHSAPQWTTSTLSNHLELLTSGSRGWAQYYSKSGDIFIRAQNLKHDCLNLDDIAYVGLPENSEGMRTRVQPGDVLITITGANVTKTGYVKADIGTAYVSQHVALVRPARTTLTEFLYWFLIAEAAGRKQLSVSAYGAGKPGLNLENIRSVKIDLPLLDEQTEIVSRINSMLSIEEAVAAQLEREIGVCDALRRSILKKAFSGQLLAQDPHDEHASVLLDRIRAEKAKKDIYKKKIERTDAA